MTVTAKNIYVSFPGVIALQDLDIKIENGRIHAILGANGSGKSTLVKVLTGVYHPDKGHGAVIDIDGKKFYDFANPSIAKANGIRVVHQETPLINAFTVAECVALFKGYPWNRMGKIDWKALYKYVDELFEVFNIKLDPHTLTVELKASERNMVAMAIAIGKDQELDTTKVLILDEADASVPEAEAEGFLQHVRRITDMGIPVAMVTHRLKEVKAYCDDVTILNGGKVVYSGDTCDTDEDFIISKMTKEVEEYNLEKNNQEEEYSLKNLWKLLKKTPPVKKDTPVLEFKDVYAKNINGLSFQLKCNEILGFVGIPDSGVCELPLVLGGDLIRKSGEYLINDRPVPQNTTPYKTIQMGVSVLPSDRITRGAIQNATLRENMLLPNEKQYWHKSKLASGVIRNCENIFDILPRNNMYMDFGKFSGGNQQKAIIGKWLIDCPSVFVLDDPTYGVDPASRLKVVDAIFKASEQNVGIIIFSTEPEQLAWICTRVLVLRGGKIVCELNKKDGSLVRDVLAKWCYA